MAKDETAAERMRRYRARLRGEEVPHHRGGRPKKAAAEWPRARARRSAPSTSPITPPGREEADPDWNKLVHLWPMKVRDLLELSTKAIAWRMAVMKVATAPHPPPEDYVRCVEAVRAGAGQEYLTPDKADNLLRIVADLDVLIPRLTAYREALAPYAKTVTVTRPGTHRG